MNEDELDVHEELMAYNPLASMVPYGRMELSEAEFHCPEILQFGEDNLCLAIMLTQHEHFRPEESGKQWNRGHGIGVTWNRGQVWTLDIGEVLRGLEQFLPMLGKSELKSSKGWKSRRGARSTFFQCLEKKT